jgi:hypothetical protein
MAILRQFGAQFPGSFLVLSYGTMACFFWRQMAWNLQRFLRFVAFSLFTNQQSANLRRFPDGNDCR